MKTIYTVLFLLLSAQLSFSNSTMCPDPPINDDPCIESDNPPFDLTGGGSHEGTTCCATLDYENYNCSAASEGASVWYMYTPNSEDDGYNITLDAAGVNPVAGPLSIEVYAGTTENACFNSFEVVLATSCVETFASLNIGNCFASDESIFIKVSTTADEANCGDFIIIMAPASCGVPFADTCSDLDDIEPLFPWTDTGFSIDYLCVEGCLDFACPEQDDLGGCPEFQEMPTVWFKVIVDDIAAQMFTTIEPNGNWEAVWSVFSGPDCNNLSVVDFGGAPPCSNGDNTPDLHQNSVFDSEPFYWIMVTIDPASLPASGLDDGTFELCISTTINAIICLGELEGGSCDDESLFIEVVDRELEDLPLEGPFCQGEEVTIHISFFYDATESGSDWLIGFVPSFGPGWDLIDFDYDESAPFGNGIPAQWYAEESQLAPILQEPSPILCTYRDDDGVLQLCNQLCSPCTECDVNFMVEGDPLPSGYFWVTNGGNAGCDNDGSPGEGWGIGTATAQVDWEFTLKVKEFDDFEACSEKNSLAISFQTFSDGTAGCWEDPLGECLLDRAMFSQAWEIECEVPTQVEGEDAELCASGTTDILVQTVDGSVTTIIVEAIDNPNVVGESGYVFPGGTGTIDNDLLNLTDEVQIVIYNVYTEDDALPCTPVINEIQVTVYPELIASFPETFVCEGSCVNITPDIIGGKPGPYTYFWSVGDDSPSIEVCPVVTTTYTVTIGDALGCLAVAEVEVEVVPESDDCVDIEKYKLIYDFFVDVNKDGIRDSLDLPFGEGSFFLEPTNALYYNTTLEADTLLFVEGDYTASYNTGGLPGWELTTVGVFEFTLDSLNKCVTVEFGLSAIELLRDVDMTHFLVRRCNSDRDFHMIARNKGESTESGILWAELDEELIPNDFTTNATIDTFVSPNIVGWFFNDLQPGEKVSKSVEVHIPGPPDFPVGGVLNSKIYVELNNSTDTPELWDEREISGNVQCGYDPNDKAVEPSHEEGYTDIDQEELTFKIRFQNTGNDVAEDIQIRDTLSEYFNLASVEYVGGSHDEYLSFSRFGSNVLLFRFDKINLPDSTTDYQGSQGFLIYKVSLLDNLPEGTLIENTAHIYFDNNPAVVTNTTGSILYDDLDNDGFYSIEDCDEENADINPDAEEIPNNDIDEDCDGIALIIDNDMDGFNSDEDCNDEDPDINPDAEEIINNTIDENCDDLVVIIDADMDGFNSDEDCNEEDADINPDAEEIPNNEIDENCDGIVLIIDADMDGFNSDEDCNEEDASINPDAEEIPNNEIDENCDGIVLIIDVDMDGFNSDEDCNDDNVDINPDAEEIPNNEIDENCDGIVLIIDADMDGFNSDEDCNDDNADINPDAEDIPGNGIDEDCDGVDAVVSSIDEELQYEVSINPNPSNDAFNITLTTEDELDYIIRDMVGREVGRGKINQFNKTVFLGNEPNGVYFIVLTNAQVKYSTFHKLLKI